MKAFLVHDQTDYGSGLQKLIKQSLAGARQAGEDSAARGTTDYAPIIAKIKKSKANAVFYSGYFADAAIFVKQLRDSGSKAVLHQEMEHSIMNSSSLLVNQQRVHF